MGENLHLSRFLVVAGVVCVAVTAFAEHKPYERYQTIVDRQMFGQPPPGFDPTKPASEVSSRDERAREKELTKEQEQLKSAIRFSMINVTPAGDTAVGFTDNSNAKEPKHYYLKVGESRDGWTVKEADPVAATMTVVKGEIEVALSLGGDSAKGGGTRRAGSGQPPGQARNPELGFRSLRSRRTQRAAAAEAERKAAAEKAAAEKAAAEEREALREAERAAKDAEREKENEELKKNLLAIKDELKKQREEAESRKEEKENGE